MHIQFIFPLLLSVFLLGCTALTSEMDEQGVVYYLPKTILDISVTQKTDTQTGRVWYHLGALTESEKSGNISRQLETKIKDETVPDINHRYVLHYNPSPMSDDRLCISRSAEGLLYDVEFAADDKTPEIVFNVSRFLKGILGEANTSISQVTDERGIEVRTFGSRVDPFNDKDITAFNNNLRRVFGAPVKLSFDRMKELLKARAKSLHKGCSLKDGNCTKEVGHKLCSPGHICYRTKLQMPVDLKLYSQTVDVDYAPIINSADMGAISVKRAFLVHTITRLRFDKGTLVGATIRKPSEAEEASLLPIHVLNAALITPTGLWANALSGSNDNSDLISNMNSLTASVNSLAQKQQATFDAFSPNNVPVHEKTEFIPNCKFGRGVNGPTINLVKNQ